MKSTVRFWYTKKYDLESIWVEIFHHDNDPKHIDNAIKAYLNSKNTMEQ